MPCSICVRADRRRPHPGTGPGETTPDVETVIDKVVAPMMYRILFRPEGLETPYARQLVSSLLETREGEASTGSTA